MQTLFVRLPLLIASALFASSAPGFGFEELRRGVSEQEARTFEENRGHKVSYSEPSRTYFVQRASDNKLVAQFAVCKGRVYEYVTEAAGGAVGFVKRVAQFNDQYGKGEVTAESKMVSVGEYNMVRVIWKRGDQVLTLTFFPQSTTAAESQWIGYAIPRICSA